MESYALSSDAPALHIAAGTALDAAQWDAFIWRSPQGGLYHLHGYASVVYPGWRAAIVAERGVWVAVMLLCESRRGPWTSLSQPVFAQYWGVCFAPQDDLPMQEQLSRQDRWLRALLPVWCRYHLVAQSFAPSFAYPLPFVWAGATLHTRYTFQLSLLPAPATLMQGLADPLRRQIRKAQRAGLVLHRSGEIGGLLHLLEAQRAAGHDILGSHPHARRCLPALAAWLCAQGLAQVLELRDATGALHAAGLFARYRQTTLYLIGAYDPVRRQSGAMSALMWEAIRDAQAAGGTLFDFEGSMIEGIAHFFRKFGAHPVPYLQLRHNQLPLPIRWIHALR
ncbi:MAG: GNAT family N-acetyltransferase [Bacteroidia bacterium]